MEYSGEDIKKKKEEISDNILKSFDSNIEKSVAQIGEIRIWSDGKYKKISNGEWVKIKEEKEKPVAQSTMIKKIKEEIESNQKKINNAKNEFEKTLNSKYSKESRIYIMFFENAWMNEVQENKFIQKITQEQKDLTQEIEEIKRVIELKNKSKRESETGKEKLVLVI